MVSSIPGVVVISRNTVNVGNLLLGLEMEQEKVQKEVNDWTIKCVDSALKEILNVSSHSTLHMAGELMDLAEISFKKAPEIQKAILDVDVTIKKKPLESYYGNRSALTENYNKAAAKSDEIITGLEKSVKKPRNMHMCKSETSFQCNSLEGDSEECQSKFKLKNFLYSLDKSSRKSRFINTSGRIPQIKCDTCDKKFSENSRLRSHMDVHIIKIVKQCCSKNFDSKYEFNNHNKETHKSYVYKFKCQYEDCGSSFSARCDVLEHMSNNHFGPKYHPLPTYECKFCENKFTKQKKARIHARICSPKAVNVKKWIKSLLYIPEDSTTGVAAHSHKGKKFVEKVAHVVPDIPVGESVLGEQEGGEVELVRSAIRGQNMFHQVSLVSASLWLHLSNLQSNTTIDSLSFVVVYTSLSVLPYINVRENPNVTSEEELLIRRLITVSSNNTPHPTTPATNFLTGECEEGVGEEVHRRLLRPTEVRLFQNLEVDEDSNRGEDRIYDSEIIERRPDISLILVMHSTDAAFSLNGTNRTINLNRVDLPPVPLQAWLVLHLFTYHNKLWALYANMSSILDVDLSHAKQSQSVEIDSPDDSQISSHYTLNTSSYGGTQGKGEMSRIQATRSDTLQFNVMNKENEAYLTNLEFVRSRLLTDGIPPPDQGNGTPSTYFSLHYYVSTNSVHSKNKELGAVFWHSDKVCHVTSSTPDPSALKVFAAIASDYTVVPLSWSVLICTNSYSALQFGIQCR